MTTQLFTEDGDTDLSRISAAEEHYQENETFVDDGIQIEPVNLERERGEGFFDEAGNVVEYAHEKEEKVCIQKGAIAAKQLATALDNFNAVIADACSRFPNSEGVAKMQAWASAMLEVYHGFEQETEHTAPNTSTNANAHASTDPANHPDASTSSAASPASTPDRAH